MNRFLSSNPRKTGTGSSAPRKEQRASFFASARASVPFALSTLITIVLAVTVGCNKSSNDQTITTNIKAALFSDQTTKPANIGVAVKDGQVTLSGDVPSTDVALEAMKVANGTPGVKGVSDQMTINGASAANQLPDVGSTGAPASAAGQAPVTPTNPPANPYASSQPPPPGAQPPPGEGQGPVPGPQPVALTIPAGDRITIRTIDAIDSNTAQTGQVFRATVAEPVRVHGEVAIPAGADATLDVAEDRSAGRVAGRAALELRLVRVSYRGHRYPIESSLFEQTGDSRTKQTAVRTGIGAAAGAVIGAIAGRGKGAAIGSVAGGGAGFGSDFFTKGPRVHIPAETLIAFRLQAPVRIER